MKKVVQYLHNNLYLELFCLILFILSFCFEPFLEVFKGYGRIITSSSILLTDYVYVGGIGATLFNVATILLFNLVMLKLLKIKISGPVYCGILLITGFSFFGKNIFNTLPIYFGIWLYSRFKKLPFKSLIIVILFSTGISPLVSYAMFGLNLPYYISIPLGLVCGMTVGFILPAYAAHTIVFHQGYNIYNIGFALGILSAIFYALFRLCGLEVATVKLYDDTNSMVFYILLGVMSGIFIFLALCGDIRVFKKYFRLLKTSGRLVSDYIKEFGVEAVMLNFGILGIFMLIIFASLRIPLNGILFGSILSVLGCGAFGVHLRNVVPIWVGSGLAIIVIMAVRQNFTIQVSEDLNMLVAFVFACGLAPICGKFGFIYGLIGGFMHIMLTPSMIALQGGFDLYNNGLSAGFEASVLAVCAEKIFYREKKNAKKSKDL